MSLTRELREALVAIDRVLRRRRRVRRERRAYGIHAPQLAAAPPILLRPRGIPGMDEGDEPFALPDVGAELVEEAEQIYLRQLLAQPEVRIFADGDRLVIQRGRW